MVEVRYLCVRFARDKCSFLIPSFHGERIHINPEHLAKTIRGRRSFSLPSENG